MSDHEITESWKDKKYEQMFTEYFFDVMRRLRVASNVPVLINLRMAFNDVRSLCYGMIYSKSHMKQFGEKIKPVLDDIETILFGKTDDPIVLRSMFKYNIIIEKDRRGQHTVTNAQNITTQLWEILFFVKQWAYEAGFFVIKPYARKVGIEAMEDAFAQ